MSEKTEVVVVGGGYAGVMAPRVRLVVDAAIRIDAAGRQVSLAEGGALGHDHLVYALGSGSADPTVPGAAEHTRPPRGPPGR